MSFRSPQNGYIYKIETHCHTAELSPCGNIPVRELIDRYAAAGYSAITLCDHLRVGYTLPREGDRHAVADRMADVYENAVEYGKTRGMRVYKGSELCFDATCPDEFIMLGWDRSFLRRTVDLLDRETVGEYHRRTLARGGLLIQAHPFRGECLPVEGEAVDGYEILNAHPRHDSKNDLAEKVGCAHGGIMTAGSDCHDPDVVGLSGIWVRSVPENTDEYISLLKSGDYGLIGKDEPK